MIGMGSLDSSRLDRKNDTFGNGRIGLDVLGDSADAQRRSTNQPAFASMLLCRSPALTPSLSYHTFFGGGNHSLPTAAIHEDQEVCSLRLF